MVVDAMHAYFGELFLEHEVRVHHELLLSHHKPEKSGKPGEASGDEVLRLRFQAINLRETTSCVHDSTAAENSLVSLASGNRGIRNPKRQKISVALVVDAAKMPLSAYKPPNKPSVRRPLLSRWDSTLSIDTSSEKMPAAPNRGSCQEEGSLTVPTCSYAVASSSLQAVQCPSFERQSSKDSMGVCSVASQDLAPLRPRRRSTSPPPMSASMPPCTRSGDGRQTPVRRQDSMMLARRKLHLPHDLGRPATNGEWNLLAG